MQATEQEIFDAIFGSGFGQYSWWRKIALSGSVLDDDYQAPDGWIVNVIVDDPDDDDKAFRKLVRASDIITACENIVTDGTMPSRFVNECSNLIYDADELDMDAEDADTLMQYVMFDGEIIYG
jgi:hypothetical protein